MSPNRRHRGLRLVTPVSETVFIPNVGGGGPLPPATEIPFVPPADTVTPIPPTPTIFILPTDTPTVLVPTPFVPPTSTRDTIRAGQ